MTTKQRAYLKGLAMNIDPIFQCGKSSITPEFVAAVTEALEKMSGDVDKQIQSTFGLDPQVVGNMQNSFSPNVNVYNNVNVEQDPLGQVVSNIKTFSGGAKNDYNFGLGV
jgi:hypothetical protein